MASPSHAMFGVKELLLIVALASGQVLQSRDTDYCYADDDKPYSKFGTKTAYHFVHGARNDHEPIPHCEPVQIWMLVRHGTRYPGVKVIQRLKTLPRLRDEIIGNHEGRGDDGRLCNADLENLRNWHLDENVQPEFAEQLTEQGVEDMKLLGRRIRSYFPELFPPVIANVSAANYRFRSANGEPMTSSKMALMSGLFERVDIPDADIPANDTLFASYRNCPRWETEVADNFKFLIELTRFATGPEYQNLISNVSWRLGFQNNITADSVHDMWDMCRYDKAWKVSELSPWCAVFTEKELRVLQYEDNLIDYYKRGHGHEFNLRLGCPPMQHLFQHFQKLESGDYYNEPKGLFNVASSGSLHLFMAAMGFAKDPTPPLASDFPLMDRHLWRTSEMGSFAANIVAVFYKCNNTESPNKVMFYQAEKPVFYEGCEAGLCDWEYLKTIFPNATAPCNSDFCHPGSSAD